MARLIGLARVLFVLSLSASLGRAESFPALEGEVDRAECRIALEMAEAAYRSTSPTLHWPVVEPSDAETRIVMSRTALDISGGEGVRVDAEVFERKPDPDGREVAFLQRQDRDGGRLAVTDVPFGWQGDWYRVFWFPSGVRWNDLSDGRNYDWVLLAEAPNARVQLVLDDYRWSPPVVLQNKTSQAIWLIDMGELYEIMPPWKVWVTGGDRMTSVCTIRFAPPEEEIGLKELPKSVRRFAKLADGTLGSGRDEGTLQTTSRIRREVGQAWALATERPWALTGTRRNSRAAVDAGLQDWAKDNPASETLLRELTESMDAAEKDLARYYQDRFGLASGQATAASDFVLDYLLRSHFHFPDGTEEAAVENPWPMDVRGPKGGG
jgi:hypothetical protein